MAETSLVVFDFGNVWVIRKESDSGTALLPKLGTVVWTETGDTPDRGAWVLSIKEVSCIGRTLLNRWRGEMRREEKAIGRKIEENT